VSPAALGFLSENRSECGRLDREPFSKPLLCGGVLRLRTKWLLSLFALVLLLVLVDVGPVLADDASNVLGTYIGAIVCLLVALVFMTACGIYALYFLYTDAEARSGNGIMWLLIGLIAGWPWVLIVWLIIRPQKKA
jgi:hypothetical protein